MSNFTSNKTTDKAAQQFRTSPLAHIFRQAMRDNFSLPVGKRASMIEELEMRLLLASVTAENFQELGERCNARPLMIRSTLPHATSFVLPENRQTILRFLSSLPLNEEDCMGIYPSKTRAVSRLPKLERMIVDSLASGWTHADIAEDINETSPGEPHLDADDIQILIDGLSEKLGTRNERQLAAMGLVQHIRENRSRRILENNGPASARD